MPFITDKINDENVTVSSSSFAFLCVYSFFLSSLFNTKVDLVTQATQEAKDLVEKFFFVSLEN